MTDLVKKHTLAEYAFEIEKVCDYIDNFEGPIPESLIKAFAEKQADLATKVESWIGFLDAVKSRIELLKEQKERVTKAVKTAENFQRGLKDYLRYVLEAAPSVQYKCDTGRIALQKNPRSLKIDFETKDVTVYNQIDKALIDLEPSLNAYIKPVTLYVMDNEKLKADLDAGMLIPWARFEAGNHIRIRV